MSLSRLGCLSLLVVSFIGCDTEEPTSALVGTWSVDSYVFREIGRASESQVIIDLDRPPEGGFVISGAESVTLGYVLSFSFSPSSGGSMRFTNYDPSQARPDDYYLLEVERRNRANGPLESLDFNHIVSGRSNSYFSFTQPPPALFTAVDAAITINAKLPNQSTPTDSVHITGTLTLGNRTLRVGEDDLISENIQRPGISITGIRFALPPQYMFSGDGSLRIVTPGQRGTDLVETGTWELIGDQLAYSVANGRGEVRTGEHEVQWRGSTLVLANQTSTEACDAPCRYQILADVGGKPGTLLAYWQEREIVLSASSAGE